MQHVIQQPILAVVEEIARHINTAEKALRSAPDLLRAGWHASDERSIRSLSPLSGADALQKLMEEEDLQAVLRSQMLKSLGLIVSAVVGNQVIDVQRAWPYVERIMGAVLKGKLLSHIGAWCLVPPALSSTPVTHSGIELRQPKSIQQTQRFALQFLSLISHPVPSAQYIPRDATKLKSRSVYAFPLACAAKEDALRTRRSSHSNAQGVSARDGESKERSGEEAERFWYTYPSRNTMDDQAILMARIRRAVLKGVMKGDSAGLDVVVQITVAASASDAGLASPLLASALRLLLQLCRASSDVAEKVCSMCKANGTEGILDLIQILRGQEPQDTVDTASRDDRNAARSTLSPSNGLMVSQELLALELSEQRSTSQGLALLLARELVESENRLQQLKGGIMTDKPQEQLVSDPFCMEVSRAAVEIIQNGSSDVRVLSAAAGVVARGLAVGMHTALNDEDRTWLMRACQSPQFLSQLRRVLCFPGFVIFGKGAGDSMTSGQSLEGCCYGIRTEGLLDGVLLLLYRGSGDRGLILGLSQREPMALISSRRKEQGGGFGRCTSS